MLNTLSAIAVAQVRMPPKASKEAKKARAAKATAGLKRKREAGAAKKAKLSKGAPLAPIPTLGDCFSDGVAFQMPTAIANRWSWTSCSSSWLSALLHPCAGELPSPPNHADY